MSWKARRSCADFFEMLCRVHTETGLDLAETCIADVSAAETAGHPAMRQRRTPTELGVCDLAGQTAPAIRPSACCKPLDSGHAVQFRHHVLC